MKRVFSRFSKRERVLFSATAVVIAVIMGAIFILEPMYKKWTQSEEALEGASSRLLKNLRLLADKELLEKQYAAYKEFTQRQDSEEEELAAALKEMESIALNSQVKITSIKPKGAKPFKNYKRYIIEIIAEAKINQFLKFIYDLEGSKNLLKVERLVLSLKSAQSDVLKGTLVIRKTTLLK